MERKILAAEDNVFVQDTLREILDQRGYFFKIVPNGAEVLKEIAKDRYDLILMDLQMPEMDGWEATAQIREQERDSGGHIPIIALTGSCRENGREECLKAGMDDYLAKPYDVMALYKAIEEIAAC